MRTERFDFWSISAIVLAVVVLARVAAGQSPPTRDDQAVGVTVPAATIDPRFAE
jgi:hypothetical protein